MKDKKLQIFVSSTFTDLKEERQAAVEAILSSGHIPAGMELFSAGDESQMSVIKRWIDESDVYLLILGGRYGSIEKKSGKSYTHLEYEYALAKQKPLFAVVISNDALEKKVKLKGTAVLEQDNTKELKEFKSIILKNLVKFWDDKKDIKIAIHETISEFSFRKDLIGWVRADNVVNTAFLAQEIARLTSENSELRKKQAAENNTALYSNLTYEQLEALLKKEIVNMDEKEMTLFDFILEYGRVLTSGIQDGGLSPTIVDKMMVYKLLKRGSTKTGYAGHKFSDDGHDFFLKSIFMAEGSYSNNVS